MPRVSTSTLSDTSRAAHTGASFISNSLHIGPFQT